jgi:hypothetical protein
MIIPYEYLNLKGKTYLKLYSSHSVTKSGLPKRKEKIYLMTIPYEYLNFKGKIYLKWYSSHSVRKSGLPTRKEALLWNITSSSQVEIYRCFRGTNFFHLQDWTECRTMKRNSTQASALSGTQVQQRTNTESETSVYNSQRRSAATLCI